MYLHCSTVYNGQDLESVQVLNDRFVYMKLWYIIYPMVYYLSIRKYISFNFTMIF